ncbi:unnamed protein product, partial [Mesorhabditis spiculigera]
MSYREKLSLRAAAKHVLEGSRSYPAPKDGEASTSLTLFTETPCFETFATRLTENQAQMKYEEDIRVGDVILAKVKRFDAAGAFVKPLCTMVRIKRDLEWLDIQLVAPVNPLQRRFNTGEKVIVDVLALNPIKISIRDAPPAECVPPPYFSDLQDVEGVPFWKWASKGPEQNPYLEEALRMPTRCPLTFLRIPGLDKDVAESSAILRKRQNRDMAMEAVARGVQALKDGGGLLGAVPLFNKAIEYNPECVEAFVARGAAYANEDQLDKAVEDLEVAISLDPVAKNASIYLLEVLLKLANRLIEEGEKNEAIVKLTRCLDLDSADQRIDPLLKQLGVDRSKDNSRRSPSVEIVDAPRGGSMNGERKRHQEDEMSDFNKEKRRREEQVEREKEKQANREKLMEFEKFIAAMKNT